MLVDVVQLRLTGMKLKRDEIAEIKPIRGNLTIAAGWAYLHAGDNPHLGQHVIPLTQARVTHMRGPEFIVTGYQRPGLWTNGEPHRQSWWCRVVYDK